MVGLSFGSVAQAMPDARIDQEIRPCFGLLLRPEVSRRCQAHHGHKGGAGLVRAPSTYIDCAYAYPGQISDTIARTWNGVTIYLTSSNGRGCRESVVINRDARILGDPDRPVLFIEPLLLAPQGQPCIRMAPGLKVDIRGVSMAQDDGDRSACILGQDDDLFVSRSDVSYSGASNVIALAGDSRLTIVDSRIVSRSQEAAIVTRGKLKFDRVNIGAAVIGVKAGLQEDSRIDNLTLVRLDDWTGSRRSASSAGLALMDIGPTQLVEISGLDVTGFSRGAYVAGGGEVSFIAPKFSQTDWALLVEGPTVRVSKASINAQEVGIYAASGTTFINGADITGVMRSGIFAERGAQVRSVDNVVHAPKEGCAALKSGYFDGALTCRPWFDAPELGGGKDRAILPTYDSLRKALDDESRRLYAQEPHAPKSVVGPGTRPAKHGRVSTKRKAPIPYRGSVQGGPAR